MRKAKNKITSTKTPRKGRKRSEHSILNVLDSLKHVGNMAFVPLSQVSRGYISSMISNHTARTGHKFRTQGGSITAGTAPKSTNETVEGIWIIRKE